jgi:hypothetical protein
MAKGPQQDQSEHPNQSDLELKLRKVREIIQSLKEEYQFLRSEVKTAQSKMQARKKAKRERRAFEEDDFGPTEGEGLAAWERTQEIKLELAKYADQELELERLKRDKR